MDLVEDGGEAVAFGLEVVAGLQVHPEPFGGAEVACEPEGGIGADATLAVHDLVDASRRHPDGNGEAVLGDAERFRYSSARISPGWIGGMVGRRSSVGPPQW